MRAPRFLRVVRTAHGHVYALARLDESPAADEIVDVYQRDGGERMVSELTKLGRQILAEADYRWVNPQPEARDVYGKIHWQQWCVRQSLSQPSGGNGDDTRGVH